MLTKKRYSFKDMMYVDPMGNIGLSRICYCSYLLYHHVGYAFLKVPWTPVAVVGTAVAFIIGFQNNSAYGRIWEARKIWGGIVNTSRTWGMKTKDMISCRTCYGSSRGQ